MNTDTIKDGIYHQTPEDIKNEILKNPLLVEHWNALTPIARNEWICWATIVKKAETRSMHIQRLCVEISSDKKRPCCWPGCPHRNENVKKWIH